MQVGVFAKTFAGIEPLAVLMACKNAGFDCVQYNMSCSGLDVLPNKIHEEVAAKVLKASLATGIRIAAISATYNMTDPDLTRRAAGRAAFTAIAKRASAMGSKMLTVCSGSMDPKNKWQHHTANKEPANWTRMCREFEVICGIAESHGLFIGVEPESANIVSSAEHAADLLKTFAGGPIRIVFDPANIIENVESEDHNHVIEKAFDLLGPMIGLAHAKDRYSDGRVAPAGKGLVDWTRFLRCLSSYGYKGPLIAHGMSALEAPEVAKFLSGQLEAAL